MVLDTIDGDMLIFKNTYDDPENGQSKQVKVGRNDPNAPEEFYFVHIEFRDSPTEEPVSRLSKLLRSMRCFH